MAKRADFLVNAETKGTDKIKDMSVSVKDLERAQKAAAKATRNIRRSEDTSGAKGVCYHSGCFQKCI